jgi:alanyl-tRNA synthetase
MQHHSGQHVLSQAIQDELGLETISVKISADRPSTIDVLADDLSKEALDRAEDLANHIVLEDRPIHSYLITHEEVHTVPFRRPPAVEGQIRVVEVDRFDYSACGGTHCLRTGMIGTIKILKTERRGGKQRIHFAAGQQAMRYFQRYQGIVTDICRFFNTDPDAVTDLVVQQGEQWRFVQKELEHLQAELLAAEARTLLEKAQRVGPVQVVLGRYSNRAAKELRALASLLQEKEGVVALLAMYDGKRLTLTVSCADDTGINAGDLLRQQLALIGGKGGGSAQLAQGGGEVESQEFEAFFADTMKIVRRWQERM